jgi:hypothetical protein
MSKGAAQQMVVVSMLVTAAVVGYDVIAHGTDAGDPSAFKTVWALGVLIGRGNAVKQITSVIPSAGGAQK